jgi:hypothetical protein
MVRLVRGVGLFLNFNLLYEVQHFRTLRNTFDGSQISPCLTCLSAMNTFIFELPRDISADLLNCWVDIKTLAKLDTALCSFGARPQLLSHIENHPSISDTTYLCKSPPREKVVRYCEWLAKRQIRLKSWTVQIWSVAMFCSPLFGKCIAGVHTLHVYSLTAEEVVKVYCAIAVACSALQTLRVENCQDWEPLRFLGEAALTLRELFVMFSESRQCAPFPQFPSLRKLQVGYLEGSHAWRSTAGLLKVAPNLTDFRLNGSGSCHVNRCLKVLSKFAAGLEILVLNILFGKFSISTATSLAEHCTNLRTLSFTCREETYSTVVEAFALHCPRLEGLLLGSKVTAASWPTVAMRCGSKLRFLMACCGALGMKSLAEHCPLLEELQLFNCSCPADDSLVRLVSSLPRLRELVFVECDGVTDEVLVAIATHLPALSILGLHGCAGDYTVAGAVALVTSLTQLQRFCVHPHDTSAFTPALRKRWQEASPGLEVVESYQVCTRYFERTRW